MLSLAAREAESISIMFKVPAQGVDAENKSLEQKIAWLREAADERFAHLELAQLAYILAIDTGRVGEDAEEDAPPLPRVIMTANQAVEHLLEQRERYGFSYIPVYGSVQMEEFAPVVARLAGN